MNPTPLSDKIPREPYKFDVSVLTPCYGESEDMLRRNIKSVANQPGDYSVQHILVLDEGKPETALALGKLTAEFELDKKMQDNSVVIIIKDVNEGLSAARNTALVSAEGEYIMLLDADDMFVHGRVQNQIQFMKLNYLDHCYGGYQEVLGNNACPAPDAPLVIPPQNALAELYKGINPCFCGSNCVKRSVFEKVGNFETEQIEYQLHLVKARDGLKYNL